jgi:hypothetical protein
VVPSIIGARLKVEDGFHEPAANQGAAHEVRAGSCQIERSVREAARNGVRALPLGLSPSNHTLLTGWPLALDSTWKGRHADVVTAHWAWVDRLAVCWNPGGGHAGSAYSRKADRPAVDWNQSATGPFKNMDLIVLIRGDHQAAPLLQLVNQGGGELLRTAVEDHFIKR